MSADAIQELAKSERDIICRKSSGALWHDELEDNFNSLYIHQFASMVAQNGLQFIHEAVYNEGQPPLHLTEDAARLLEQARARGLVEVEAAGIMPGPHAQAVKGDPL